MSERQVTRVFQILGFFIGGALALMFLWSVQDAGAATPCEHGGNGENGPTVVMGTNGPDKLGGGCGPDIVYGKGGRDRIWLGRGPDQAFCGGGFDTVHNLRNTGHDYVDPSCERVVT